MGRHLIGGEAEERPDRGEAKVAGARADAPCLLDLGQERGDERGVDLLECQPIGGRAQPLLGKAQQQPECVPIGLYRMRADPLLLHQSLGEELLQERREGRKCGVHAEVPQ